MTQTNQPTKLMEGSPRPPGAGWLTYGTNGFGTRYEKISVGS